MGKFMGGAIWGAIVGVLGLGVVSQLAPVPGAMDVATPEVVADVAVVDPAPARVPAAAPPPDATKEPKVDVEASTVAEAAPAPDSAPAVVPVADAEPAQAELAPAAPQVTADAPAQAPVPVASAQGGLTATGTDGVVAAIPSAPLAQPATETAPVLVQAPAEPPVARLTEAPSGQTTPEATSQAVVPAADAPAQIATAENAIPFSPSAEAPPAVADLPPPPPLSPEEQAMLDAAMAGAAPLEPIENPIAPAPEPIVVVEGEPQATPEQMAEPVPAAIAAPEADAAASAEPATDTATLAPKPAFEPAGIIADAAPSTLAPTPRLGADDALIERSQPQEDTAVDVTEPLPEATDENLPPLARYAAPFENPDAKPLFSVVLIDDGAADLDRATLAALPFAVSFVVDPLAPDAAEAAAIYRAGGKEVLMLATGIPEGATPADLEQTFQAHAAALPEAVAVIDLADAGFQGDRALATQLVPILAAQGRGLLTWDKGLNAADQVARREALPTAMVFRALDAEGEDTPVIRRYLDRAAFKAAQEGAVTVVGQARPETVAALLEWAVEGRASTVAIAPVSAVLAGQ